MLKNGSLRARGPGGAFETEIFGSRPAIQIAAHTEQLTSEKRFSRSIGKAYTGYPVETVIGQNDRSPVRSQSTNRCEDHDVRRCPIEIALPLSSRALDRC